jgi:hypothetical protein
MSTITLTADQDAAMNAFLDFLVGDENFFVIQGAAGTGKSFLINYLLETFHAKYSSYCLLLQKEPKKFDVQVTATTNKAVGVVAGFLRHTHPELNVVTIFSLLGLKVVNDKNTGKTSLQFTQQQGYQPLSGEGASLVFIDEASFINEQLQEIIEATLGKEKNSKIVYIGDPYQLAPVGQNFSALDYVQCPKATLDEVMRNGGPILHEGTKFRKTVKSGVFTPITFDQRTMTHTDGSTFQNLVEQSFSDPNWDVGTSKILAWTNARVEEYNRHVRAYMQRPPMFEVGEMVITNEFIKGNGNFVRSVDSEVEITTFDKYDTEFHGVIGNMVEIDHGYVGFLPKNYTDKKAKMNQLAKEGKWPLFFEIKESWLDLRAVYASSVHKAQGSTYDTVFIDLTDIGKNWNAEDVARLMYVAITRAAKQVFCHGKLPARYT